ncbi:MAG: EamA family transporter [Clostridium sp.]|jgi:drug/metabolite transporter (DMT)-like permease|uniref:DMT family transporter n=1 Tax=Clostridium sp. TaxID=1506 RepID=UPI0025C516A7|nr:EamA family transporter [Clostridium sp.]MCH3965745.1 EamA family transporter [Clostridium sp.]MCI1717154.1 EamA family transporter [Clostridium sp.]MCI1801494.1 EamA family transporter [Clostridium sp.]MCI1815375.1 EamA family transporter [Clostridium sp.]MCI1872278.1 EamA family transporter [Clostridium sp.]
MKSKLIGFLCLFLAATIWGGMYVVSKYILEFVSSITLVWIRYFIACIILFPALIVVNHRKGNYNKMGKKDWLLVIWIGFIGYFVSIVCQFIGTSLSDAHTGSLITAASPVFVVLFARFILGESLTKRKVVSLFLSVIGVIIIVGFDSTGTGHFLGSIILVGAAVTWALLSVYVKIASRYMDAITITAYAMLAALIFTTPFMISENNNFIPILNNNRVLIGIIYLGIVSTAGAFFLWNKGIEMVEAGTGSLFLFFQPITGSFLGWLCLGEQLTSSFFIGGILIIFAVVIASKSESYTEINNVK